MIETIGITATLFVLVSFLFKKERKIRLVNIIGASLFVIYGAFYIFIKKVRKPQKWKKPKQNYIKL